jgi:eukaryotic-like serine/threonine-protein kinase
MHVAASTGRVVAGRYLLQNTIGRGAMGTVWRARDTVLARDVAVKEVRLRGPVPAGSVMTEETRILYERTLREARTAARLNHPAVVTIFDVVEADGSPWIVMELVDARSLDQVLTEDGPLRPAQAADLGRRVLGALACAHAAGILHRDVKPSNVLLGPDDRAVLTDFGIATLEGDSGLTQAGMVMGTPGFTAPERIRGDPASPASDLWSLGATLYAAVEGRGPFDDRGNSIAILAAIANEEAPRPRTAGPLRPVIEALLHRNPRARPDAAAVGRLLAAAGDATGNGAATSGAVTSGDAARLAARAGAPLLTAPLDLAMAGPQTQAPAGGESGPDDPWPGGQWAGPPWPGGPSPDGKSPGGQWPEFGASPSPGPAGPGHAGPWAGDTPQSGDAPWGRPASQAGPPPPGSQAAEPRAAGPRAAGPRAAGPRAGRHGATPPGLRRGLVAELAAILPRGRGGLLVVLGALAIVGAGIVAGVALTHGSSGTGGPAGAPGSPGVTAGQAGPAAGFTMTVPAGWRTAQQGAGTEFTSRAGDVSILVTPEAGGGRVPAPGQLRRQLDLALKQGSFRGYEPVGGRPFAFQGGSGVAWQFTWQPASGRRMQVLETAFRLTSPAGRQAYLVRESAPAAAWAASQPVFRQALSTFRARS